jgi:hypothetical protein
MLQPAAHPGDVRALAASRNSPGGDVPGFIVVRAKTVLAVTRTSLSFRRCMVMTKVCP